MTNIAANWKRLLVALALTFGMAGAALAFIVPAGGAAAAEAGMCVDPDGDGFGWNGVETCSMNNSEQDERSTGTIKKYKRITVRCIDSDGDGWGWAEATYKGNKQSTTCQGGDVTFKWYKGIFG